MPFESNQTKQGSVLFLSNDLTVAESLNLKEELVKLMKTESSFVLDISQITEIDTSIIQLIFAAFKAAKEQEVEMSLGGHSDAFDSAIERTGIFITNYPFDRLLQNKKFL
jgi:anti-anti-sigma factor